VICKTNIISIALCAFAVSVSAETAKVALRDYSELPNFMEVGIITNDGKMRTAKSNEGESLWIFAKSKETSEQITVRKIIAASDTDIVLLDAGYTKNLRPGMICVVEHQNKEIAYLSVAEVTPEQSAGLILSQGETQTKIHIGDTVRIKTIHFN